MATLQSCKDRVKAEFAARRGEMVVFVPPKEENEYHGLLSVFRFEPRKDPAPVNAVLTACEHEEEWKTVKDQIHSEAESDFCFHTEREKAPYAGSSVSASKRGHIGLSSSSDLDIKVNITKMKHHFMKDHNTAMYNFVKEYACSFAESNVQIQSILDNSQSLKNGSVNLVIGFPCDKWEGFCNLMKLEAKGSRDLGIGVKIVSLKAKFGGGLDDEKTYRLEDTKGIFGANFIVVHLCQVLQGSVYGIQTNTRLMRSPIFVRKLDDAALLNMYYEAFPSLMTVRQKRELKHAGRLGGIFRRLGYVAQPSASSQEALSSAGAVMKCQSDDSTGAVVVSTAQRPAFGPEEGRIGERFDNSFNCVIRSSKEELDQLRANLEENGEAEICGMAVNAMSTFYEMDMKGYLPIYFNRDTHSDALGDTTTFPSTVLCYDSGLPDFWCFRPVDTVPKNNEVVTIYTKDWKVRESIVVVQEDNTDLQEELETIGFHILEAQKCGFNCSENAVVMGRHELTHVRVPGTTLQDIEFRDGLLCKAENSTEAINAPVFSSSGGAPSLHSVPTDSPDRKRMKSERK